MKVSEVIKAQELLMDLLKGSHVSIKERLSQQHIGR